MRQSCDGKLARYKHPRTLVIRGQAWPRNPTGKLLKGLLREQLAALDKWRLARNLLR